MSASTFGDIEFGIAAETGLYIESATFDFSIQEKYIANGQGDDVAGALFKAESTFSLDGAFKTTGTPSWVLGSALVIANVPDYTDFIPGYVSGGTTIINGANVSLGNETESRRTISGVLKPFLEPA